MKNSLSKKRKKFQKKYIQQILFDKNIFQLLDEYEKMLHINLNKFSDDEFIELIKDKSFRGRGEYHISQWADYEDFVNYVEENK
tara:strand:+ start:2010 stop:2261 length:252 start_codon:yes stop_codon:yes gene_type:complete